MKASSFLPEYFLPLRDFDVITSSLNFNTPACRVTGGCDLYTTKATGSDKKLYKTIEGSLESQHAALVKLGASLETSHHEEMAASLNLSRSSPFGSLSEISSRRTFAYLIATLNASHPDYDFSHCLRPADFRRARNLRRVMTSFDSMMSRMRPHGTSLLSSNLSTPYRAYSSSPADRAPLGCAANSPAWGPQMWTMIDKEMVLKDCVVFSYLPADDPFDGDEAAIWRLHYFFFNKVKKRVAYLYVRGLPIIVNSPALAPLRRGSSGSLKRHAAPLSSSLGANKRARYWLGDQLADRVTAVSYDDYYDDDNVVFYDSDDDIDFDPLQEPDNRDAESDDYNQSEEDEDKEAKEEEEDTEAEGDEIAHSFRGISEDLVAGMEM